MTIEKDIDKKLERVAKGIDKHKSKNMVQVRFNDDDIDRVRKGMIAYMVETGDIISLSGYIVMSCMSMCDIVEKRAAEVLAEKERKVEGYEGSKFGHI